MKIFQINLWLSRKDKYKNVHTIVSSVYVGTLHGDGKLSQKDNCLFQ